MDLMSSPHVKPFGNKSKNGSLILKNKSTFITAAQQLCFTNASFIPLPSFVCHLPASLSSFKKKSNQSPAALNPLHIHFVVDSFVASI
jgi:hypothetical protein